MLCCVSRKAVAGADLGPPYDHCPLREQPVESEIVVEIEQYTDPDVQGILQPCAICARTFKPQSLEKHSKICERAANKKRKPFDSSKQRIQGTELAEFLPKQEKKRYVSEDRLSKPAEPTWKQNHDEFLRAIRAARNEITDFTMQKPCGTTVTSSAPTRSNEQGACPTCNRHFGVKAYDRHVAWCKDRIAHVPVSPATNIAKERLEARMKYRAPAVKSRRQVTREKYSPSSAITLNSASKTSPNLATVKAKECASVPNCNKNNDSPVKHKPLGRRSAQTKEPAVSHVPMKSRPIDRTNSGKDYDPFVLAEQQMNELLSDTSEQSVTDDSPSIEQNRETSFPLSHSSAFVKYPCHSSLSSPEKRSSLIAPPSEFDDLVSDFSSDSTETNSLSREIFLDNLKDNKESKESKESIAKSGIEKKSPIRELGRRVIIDKSKALGNDAVNDGNRGSRSFVGSSERARKILDKVSPKVIRPSVNRSVSVRASSAPKTTPDRNAIEDTKKSRKGSDAQRCSSNSLNNRNNNYANLSSSNLSLSSIVSSDMDMKRSNSLFDELMTSFEDENGSFSSLKSLLKNDSLSSPVHGRQRNGQISDEELSSPESYKRQDRSKLSADSAYSSLNRKYSHHGRSTNDVAGRLEEDLPRCNRREADAPTNLAKCKMSKFCHECGSKFPKTAKFCCECGVRRLVL